MKHDDDDTSGFLGITYISHGDDHKKNDDTDGDDAKTKLAGTEKADKAKHTAKHPESDELEALHHELEVLESRLQTYEVETEERLKHLERLAGHPVSPEEKVFRIQEDS